MLRLLGARYRVLVACEIFAARLSKKSASRSFASPIRRRDGGDQALRQIPGRRRGRGDRAAAPAARRNSSSARCQRSSPPAASAKRQPLPLPPRYCDSPIAAPSAAPYVRPVSIMSVIRATPISRGIRTDPPPPTKMPRCPSGKRVERARLRHPDMRRRRQLQPAADHRAMQHRHHRKVAALDRCERAVPCPAMEHARRGVRLR